MKNKVSTIVEKTKDGGDWLFPLGSVFCTPGALREIPMNEAVRSLNRHLTGDWGDLGQHDRKQNDLALSHGGRILSAYHTVADRKFWIITEADRSSTTILLPEEY